MAAFEQQGQGLSLRQLELRCQVLGVDKRIAEQRCEEYRKLLSAHLGESATTTTTTTTIERQPLEVSVQTGEFRSAPAPAPVRQSDNLSVSVPPPPPDPEITPIVRRALLPPNHLPSSRESTSGAGGAGGLGRRTTGTGTVSAVSGSPLIDDAAPSRNALDNAESRATPRMYGHPPTGAVGRGNRAVMGESGAPSLNRRGCTSFYLPFTGSVHHRILNLVFIFNF
ncbi:hypothetical protein BJV74DRAFT_84039 [Russula compacta]|nr:hypothetical protein BJV74DRAFT_84039 [Russula compacta]